ncbi:MAG TPA: C25 family cysteine peptidase, partial [bacterium]
MDAKINDFGARRKGLSFVIAIAMVALFDLPGQAAQSIAFEGNWGDAGFTLVSQDAAGVEIIFSVPSMEIMDLEVNGEMMKGITIPGVILPNNAGAPNLPGTGRFIAIPQGARAQVEVVEYRTEVFHDLNIAPAFVIPRDTDPVLRYFKDPAIYGVDALYPENPVMISEVDNMRGVDVVIVGITPFQYNPVTRDLTVYKDLRVRVDFMGGTGRIGEDRLRSRFWDPILEQNLLNFSSLPRVDYNRRRPNVTDEDNVEYLIIVPDDPAFLAWADTLKGWRNQQGIITGITTLTEIGGNNATLIENYVNNAYNTWQIPPAAVLLLSDYQTSGSEVYGITSPMWNSYCVSDNIYADVNGNDLPDIAFARITAQGNQQLQTMIGKMLNYERNPSTNPNVYNQPLIAGGWQSDRWFIL